MILTSRVGFEPATAVRLHVPEAALDRLQRRLRRAESRGELWDASLAYGVDPDELASVLEHWRGAFDVAEQPLFRLRCYEAELDDGNVCFIHAPTKETGALPLLLLHGYSGSVAEFQGLVQPLTARGVPVVCPALPGFLHRPLTTVSVRVTALSCRTIMKRLGYSRYAVHGSDLGAAVALALAALDEPRVAGLHVTSVASYPSGDGELTPAEKSQLAQLSELRGLLNLQAPASPLADLAFALSRCDGALGAVGRDALLTGLTLSWALGDAAARTSLFRATLNACAPSSMVPIAVHDFPLATPSLRRFAERGHRIVEWRDHHHGGALPALEQPGWLLESLRRFCESVS